MTAKLTNFFLAEATAVDLRGSLTIVGFAPMVVPIKDVPALLQLQAIGLLEDEVGPDQTLVDGVEITISPKVINPEGDVVTAGSVAQTLAIGLRPDGQPPQEVVRNVLALGLPIHVNAEGKYRVELTVEIKGQPVLSAASAVWILLDVPSGELRDIREGDDQSD